MENSKFELVGIRPTSETQNRKRRRRHENYPILSITILSLIFTGCLACKWIMTKDPTYMDLPNYNVAPNREFLFGSDTMGRDIFSMIWYGGRVSLTIGILATTISTFIAIIYGSISGLASEWIDIVMMRLIEILISIPTLLLIILIQAILGPASIWSLAFVIGVTSWCSIAKVVRTEVKQLRIREYVLASKCMGAGFIHILWRHLIPNLIPSIMFMVVMNVHSAIIAESTLSFIGVGLPLEIISWGSMLSLSEKALLTRAWWILLIPGIFLVVTLVCITNVGNYLRVILNQQKSNL